jgi:hypothetical protein
MSSKVRSVENHARAADKPSGLGSLGVSLAINLIAPWLVYKALELHFPAPSMTPLWASALVPLANLSWNLAKRRILDVVSLITLCQLSGSLLINLVTGTLHGALVGHAFQPMALGLVFAASVVLRRALMVPLARQTMCGDDSAKQALFDAAVVPGAPARRHLSYITLGWTAGLSLQTGGQLILVSTLPASTYLLVSSVLSVAVPAGLVWASIKSGKMLEARARAKA